MNRISLIFNELPPVGTFDLTGVTELERRKKTIVLEVRENLPRVLATASQYSILDIETHNVSLEDIFLAYYSEEKGGNHV
jgi:hypothetical protein